MDFLILVLYFDKKMSEYKRQIICKTEQDTKCLAERMAFAAKKGDIFALFGTLGAGKSTFSRYFIQFLTDVEDVPSPTFTLVQMYETANFDIYHYDMYRLKQENEAYELGIEEAFYSGVNLIEWPEKIKGLLPRNIWHIEISIANNQRVFSISVLDEEKKQRLKDLAVD